MMTFSVMAEFDGHQVAGFRRVATVAEHFGGQAATLLIRLNKGRFLAGYSDGRTFRCVLVVGDELYARRIASNVSSVLMEEDDRAAVIP